VMSSDREASFASSRAVVNSVIGLAGISTGITRTKTNIKSQDRKKEYSMQLSYSNSPVYDMSELVDPFSKLAYPYNRITGFNMMSVDFSDEKPADIINEYTIINRPAQTNVLSYGYQQEPARVTISFKGNIPREGDNFTTPLSYPKLGTQKLLGYGKELFVIRALEDADIYNYYLADIKYNFNSSNDFGMTLEFAYTKKKYGNIS